MDISKFIQEQGPNLVQQLTTKAGFAPEQAKTFLSGIVNKSADLFKTGTFDLKQMATNFDVNAFTNKLGLSQIAKQYGIDEAKATAGAKAVLPGIVNAFTKGAGDWKAGGVFGGG